MKTTKRDSIYGMVYFEADFKWFLIIWICYLLRCRIEWIDFFFGHVGVWKLNIIKQHFCSKLFTFCLDVRRIKQLQLAVAKNISLEGNRNYSIVFYGCSNLIIWLKYWSDQHKWTIVSIVVYNRWMALKWRNTFTFGYIWWEKIALILLSDFLKIPRGLLN